MRMNWFKNLSMYFSYFSWIDKTKHQSEAKPNWLCNMRWHLIPKSRGCYLKKGRETYEIYQIFQSRKKDSRWDKWVCDNELCRISRACSRSRKRKQGRDQGHLTEKVELLQCPAPRSNMELDLEVWGISDLGIFEILGGKFWHAEDPRVIAFLHGPSRAFPFHNKERWQYVPRICVWWIVAL